MGSKITNVHKRRLLLGKKAMTNLYSVLKSRDITLLTKVHIVKAMFFPVVICGCEHWTIKKAEPIVMHGCESWTIKKSEYLRFDAFKL